SHNPTFNPIICQICGDDVGQFVEGGIFVACHECAYPVCRPCYDYERKEGSRACPQCKTFYKRYKGSPRIDEDDDDEDDEEARSDRGGDRAGASLDVPTTSYASYVSHNAQASSQYPMLTSNQVNPDQSVATEYNPGAMVPAGTIPPPSDYNKYERTPSRTPSQTPSANDMAMELRAPSYGYGSVVWKDRVESWKQQQGRMVVGDGNGAEEVSAGATAEGDLPSMDESRQPLSRKVHYPSSLISPYRLVIVIRLAVLVFFLRWRCLNPVDGAWWLWLISVICEVWFAFSWILDQFPKWMPIKRETYLDRLSLRFDRKGEPSQLSAVDLFVSTVDPQKEPPLTTANTLLSILSVDYPVDKVSAYVHDDGGAMLTFDAMGETAKFARRWIPFAKRYNIEPRAPEVYFTQKVDYLKDKVDQDFVKDRRQMKRDYEEFKIRINSLVARSHKMPEEGWVMQDGTPWPGSKSRDHPGMIQVFLGPSGGTDVDGHVLPRMVYVSREKRPGYNHHKKAGAMNSLIRVSAILSNAPYMLNLDCDHYLNDSKALREAMCFMMDPNVGKKCCYVQFPQRFDGIDPNDRYANHNTVFFDINLPGLDGIQGPCYVGTGCCFRRHALYGYEPPKKEKKARCGGLMCSCFSCCAGDRGKEGGGKRKQLPDGTPLPAGAEAFLGDDDVEGDSLLALKKFEKKFGQSPVFVLSTFHEEGGGVASASPGSTLKEAIHVISCGYEEKTEWGKELGWIYGSVTEDILTGFKMHARGWRSIYCKPKRATFKGGAPINLSDRLQQVLRWALAGIDTNFTVTAKQAEDGEFAELYLFKWTSLLIPPFFLIIFNVLGIVAGVAGRNAKMPTIVIVWSVLLASIFSLLWVKISPFSAKNEGPPLESCGPLPPMEPPLPLYSPLPHPPLKHFFQMHPIILLSDEPAPAVWTHSSSSHASSSHPSSSHPSPPASPSSSPPSVSWSISPASHPRSPSLPPPPLAPPPCPSSHVNPLALHLSSPVSYNTSSSPPGRSV
ncbi:unnamed protein product, partial [Closterium sp. Naga37s-1]